MCSSGNATWPSGSDSGAPAARFASQELSPHLKQSSQFLIPASAARVGPTCNAPLRQQVARRRPRKRGVGSRQFSGRGGAAQGPGALQGSGALQSTVLPAGPPSALSSNLTKAGGKEAKLPPT